MQTLWEAVKIELSKKKFLLGQLFFIFLTTRYFLKLLSHPIKIQDMGKGIHSEWKAVED